MIRVAILGVGFMGLTHYKAYEKIDGVQVTAIASRNPDKAAGRVAGISGNIGGDLPDQLPMDRIHGTTDLHEPITRDDVDVVDICLATPMHREIAIAALEAGKHVVCEKPLAATVADAEPIVAAAQAAERAGKGFFMPAMCMRFWPAWQWLKAAVDDGRFGRVQSATFVRNTGAPGGWFRDGEISGGAAMDLHIHDTDYIHWLFGTPKAVTSQGYTGATGKIDHLATFYHYDDVPLVYGEGSWTYDSGSGFLCHATLNFEHATAHFDIAESAPGKGSGLKLAREGRLEPVDCTSYGYNDGWEGQLRYFMNCVRTGERPRVVDAAAALESMRTVEAECRSAETGQRVERGG